MLQFSNTQQKFWKAGNIPEEEASRGMWNLSLHTTPCLALPKITSPIQRLWACRNTDLVLEVAPFRQNYKLMYPHCTYDEAYSNVPHFDGSTVGESGHAVHEASLGCFPWCGVPYAQAHRGRFDTPRLALYSCIPSIIYRVLSEQAAILWQSIVL